MGSELFVFVASRRKIKWNEKTPRYIAVSSILF